MTKKRRRRRDRPVPESSPPERSATDSEDSVSRSRRRRGGLRRPTRVLLGLVVLALLAGGLVLLAGRGEGKRGEVWRLHEVAVAHFDAGRYEACVAACAEILALEPEDGLAHFNRGLSLLRLGRDDEGWADVEAAAAIRPALHQAQLLLAGRSMEAGDHEAALERLRGVVRSDDSPVAAHGMMARILRDRGDLLATLPHLEAMAASPDAEPLDVAAAAVEIARIRGMRAGFDPNPNRERAREQEAYSTARRRAERALEAAETLPPEEVVALRAVLARALLGLGLHREALASVDMAVAGAPTPAAAVELRVLRAQVYWATGDEAASEEELQAVLAGAETPTPGTLLSAAEFYLSRGRRDQALGVLQTGVAVHPDATLLALWYARELFLAGQGIRAEDVLSEAVARRPDELQVVRTLAELRRLRGDLAGARELLAEALGRHGGNLDLQLDLAATDLAQAAADRDAEGAPALLDRAESQARDALERRGEDPDALVVLGAVLLLRAGEADPEMVEEARDALARAVELDPFSLDAQRLLATAELRSGRPDEAVLLFERVRALLPDEQPMLRLQLAEAYLLADVPYRAAENARAGAAALPDDPQAQMLLVRALQAVGETEEALRALEELARLQPTEIDHVLRQALLLGELGRVTDAEEKFVAAAALAAGLEDPDRAVEMETRVAATKAEFYRALGDTKAAKGAFRSLLDRTGDDVNAIVRYGRFLESLGETEEAQRQYERAIAADPGALAPRRALCDLWFGAGEVTPKLLTQVVEVERLAPDRPVAWYVRGKLAALQGDLALAKDRMAAYVKDQPNDPDGAYALGAILARAGEFEEAVARLEQAGRLLGKTLKIRSALTKARNGWAIDLFRRGRFAEAQNVLRQAVSETPEGRLARAMLADTLRLGGQVDLSEREVRYLLRKDPEDAMARRLLAGILAQRGEPDLAETELVLLLEGHPEDLLGWMMLSGVQVALGRLDDAEASARRARAIAPADPTTLTAVLNVLATRGDMDTAEREILQARRDFPSEPMYAYQMAVLRAQEGRWQEVVDAAAAALDLRPSFAGAMDLAVAAYRHGLMNTAGALDFVRRYAPLAPDGHWVQYSLAWLEARAGNRDRAIEVALPFVTREIPFQPCVTLVATLRLEDRDAVGARQVLADALERLPEAADLHFLLSQAHVLGAPADESGMPGRPARDLAIRSLQAAVERFPGHHLARNNLAYLLSADDETLPDALEHIELALRVRGGYHVYLHTKGAILLRMGRSNDALGVLREALAAAEQARVRLARRADEPVMRAEPERLAALRDQVERAAAEIRATYDEALGRGGKR